MTLSQSVSITFFQTAALARWSSPILLCLAFFLLNIPVAHGDGFRNPFQSGAANGQGSAFSAQADDPSAIYYNPAGMTQLAGVQYSAGVQFVSGRVHFTGPSGATSDNDPGRPFGWPPPGQLFLTTRLSDLGALAALKRFSIGFGLISLYGFGVKYPDNGPLATSVITAALPLLDLKPTIAYKVTDRLSIGLGADIFTLASFVGQGHFEQQVRWPGGLGFPAGSRLEVNGTGTTAGLNASLLYTALLTEDRLPRLNVGLIWRSQAVLPLHGNVLVNGAAAGQASTAIRFPESYTVAAAFWPIHTPARAWKVETDVEFVRWRSLRDADIHFSNGAVLNNPVHWHNAISVGLGTEYRWWTDATAQTWLVALRSGYFYSMAAIPNTDFSPVVPDENAHILSWGLGLTCRKTGRFMGLVSCGSGNDNSLGLKSIGLDLAYQAMFFESRLITGNQNPPVNGQYNRRSDVGTVTLRFTF